MTYQQKFLIVNILSLSSLLLFITIIVYSHQIAVEVQNY